MSGDLEAFRARMAAWDERAARLRTEVTLAKSAPSPPKRRRARPQPVRPVDHSEIVARIMKRTQAHGDCIVWLGGTTNEGYGRLSLEGRLQGPHRVVLEHKLGRRLNRDEDTRHTCDVPRCVKPEHLVAGSRLENVIDMVERGRMRQPKGFVRCPLCLRPISSLSGLPRCEEWRSYIRAEPADLRRAADVVRSGRVDQLTGEERERVADAAEAAAEAFDGAAAAGVPAAKDRSRDVFQGGNHG